MVLTVSFVLPGDRAVLPPSSADMFLSKPGWADLNSANLTPASGRQDHTTSPYAATSLVRTLGDRSQAFRQPALQSRRAQNAAASTASHPNVRDDHDTPLFLRTGWREFVEMICPTGEAKYFCKGGWTANSLICPWGNQIELLEEISLSEQRPEARNKAKFAAKPSAA